MKYSKAMSLDLRLRLHQNVDGTFITPIRVYVLYDVATMEVGDRHLETDTINSKLVILLLCKEIEDP